MTMEFLQFTPCNGSLEQRTSSFVKLWKVAFTPEFRVRYLALVDEKKNTTKGCNLIINILSPVIVT